MTIENAVPTKTLFAVTAVLFCLMAFKNLSVLSMAIIPNFFQMLSPLKALVVFVFLAAAATLCVFVLRTVKRDHARHKEKEISIWFYGAALFVLTYLLRAVWIMIIKTPVYSDYQGFYWVTNQIALNPNSPYLKDPYFHTWAYQVGFPAFMSPMARLFPRNAQALVFVNCAFEAGTVLCIFYLLNKSFSRFSSFALCCLYLLMPLPYMVVSVYTNQLSSVFFMLLGVCVLFSKEKFTCLRCCIAALSFAIGNMLRAEGIILLCATGVLIPVGLFFRGKEEKLLQRTRRISPVIAYCILYICSGMLISKTFEWTGLNPSGLKNNYPLYKFAIGLNEDSHGQYTKEDDHMLMGLNATKPVEVRDEITKKIIRERLSIGPQRLFSLISEKWDVMWTERYEQYPALIPFPDETVVSLGVMELQISTVKKVVSFTQSIWMLLLFMLGGTISFLSFFRKEVSAFVVFLSSFSVICFGVFSLVEVQKRYVYLCLPFLFLLVLTAVAEIWKVPNDLIGIFSYSSSTGSQKENEKPA